MAELSEREGDGPASPRRACMRRSWPSRGSGGGAREMVAAVLALVCPDGPDGGGLQEAGPRAVEGDMAAAAELGCGCGPGR